MHAKIRMRNLDIENRYWILPFCEIIEANLECSKTECGCLGQQGTVSEGTGRKEVSYRGNVLIFWVMVTWVYEIVKICQAEFLQSNIWLFGNHTSTEKNNNGKEQEEPRKGCPEFCFIHSFKMQYLLSFIVDLLPFREK